MKQFLVFILPVLLLLSACATATPAPATPVAPTALVLSTPDASQATPQVGSVTVLAMEGVKAVPLFSRPEAGARIAGEVLPEAQGKLLATDSTGLWALVQIGDQTGWAPARWLSILMVQ
jgi:hypothetical protein